MNTNLERESRKASNAEAELISLASETIRGFSFEANSSTDLSVHFSSDSLQQDANIILLGFDKALIKQKPICKPR